MVKYFFNNFLHANYMSELDPLEKWVELLSPFKRAKKGDDEGEEPDFHVLMLLKQEVWSISAIISFSLLIIC
jgi:hypothetical protein